MVVIKKTFLFLLTLALLSTPFIVWWKAGALMDWWRLRDYTPPPAITRLAKEDTMSDYAEHVFYVNHPDLETNANQFRSDCNETEQTIVLGCYHSDQDGIFIYDVTDKRLAGVEQVTAAHEMLHAAYDRLSASQKNYVDGLLENYFKNDLSDPRIIQTMKAYQQSEPGDVVNEMHSVFGTEIANLPAPLETYYKRYFTDRQAVTGYANSYQAEFTNREDSIKADDAELATLKAGIDQQEQALSAQLATINSDRARLDGEKSSGNSRQYNADAQAFNTEVDAYNSRVDRLKADINSYNDLVVSRNSIASELASLDKAIDTRLTPQAAQ